MLGTGGCQLFYADFIPVGNHATNGKVMVTAPDLLVTSNSHRRQMTVHRLHFFTLACCFVVDDALISFFS